MSRRSQQALLSFSEDLRSPTFLIIKLLTHCLSLNITIYKITEIVRDLTSTIGKETRREGVAVKDLR